MVTDRTKPRLHTDLSVQRGFVRCGSSALIPNRRMLYRVSKGSRWPTKATAAPRRVQPRPEIGRGGAVNLLISILIVIAIIWIIFVLAVHLPVWLLLLVLLLVLVAFVPR